MKLVTTITMSKAEMKIMKKVLTIARDHYQKRAYNEGFQPSASDVFELSQIEVWLKELE